MTTNIPGAPDTMSPASPATSQPARRYVLLVTGARTWTDEALVSRTFSTVWKHWQAANGDEPIEASQVRLVVGGNPDGADAIADRLWRPLGLTVTTFPARWDLHGPAAGPIRNQAMVDYVSQQRTEHDAQVNVAAFLALCTRPGCPQARNEQLLPSLPGHFSHGTIDALRRAGAAGIPSTWVIDPVLPPF